MINLRPIFKFNIITILVLFFILMIEFFFVEDKIRNKRLSQLEMDFTTRNPTMCNFVTEQSGLNRYMINNRFQKNFLQQIVDTQKYKEYQFEDRNLKFVSAKYHVYRDLNKQKYNHDIGIYHKKFNKIYFYVEYKDQSIQELYDKLTVFLSDYRNYMSKIYRDILNSKVVNLELNVNKINKFTDNPEILKKFEDKVNHVSTKLELIDIYDKLNCSEIIFDKFNSKKILYDKEGDKVEIRKIISVQSLIVKYLTILVILNVMFLVIYGRNFFR